VKIKLMIILVLFSFGVSAQDTLTVVAVGEAEAEKDLIGFVKPGMSTLNAEEATKINELLAILKSDFDLYRSLFVIEDGFAKNKKDSKARYINDFSIVLENKQMFLKTSVEDTKQTSILLEDKRQILFNNIRSFAHEISHVIYRAITGKESIFKSKIIFVSDRTSRKGSARKELYIMDFDGARKQRLTHLNSMVISPSLSPKNDKVLYTLIETQTKKASSGIGLQRVKNLNLHMMDLKTKRSKVLSALEGINSGAVFSKSGESIYLTLSNLKNADIFKIDLKTKKRRRITSHFSDDVDPHINADETLLTFLSGRPGRAMIYTLDPTGTEKKVKRISFVGRFNAAPRFNPSGSEIVFSSWVDNRFDIYRIDSDGRNLVRLTKNFGSNEEPWYSPDGQFIVFTSQRVITRKKAVQDVYIMDRDGEIIRKITENYGKIYTPRWSN
jgi:TolB protein